MIVILFKTNKLFLERNQVFVVTFLSTNSSFQRTVFCPTPVREDSHIKLTVVIIGNLKEIPKGHRKLMSISLRGSASKSFSPQEVPV